MYKGEQLFMEVNFKKNRADFLNSLRKHKLKKSKEEVILNVKRKDLGDLFIRIGLRESVNMNESIGTLIEAKKEAIREK